MTEEKIVELGAHDPSVESVIARLSRHADRIKHITAIVEWDDGSSDIFCDTKDLAIICYEKEVLGSFIQGEIRNKGEES